MWTRHVVETVKVVSARGLLGWINTRGIIEAVVECPVSILPKRDNFALFSPENKQSPYHDGTDHKVLEQVAQRILWEELVWTESRGTNPLVFPRQTKDWVEDNCPLSNSNSQSW